ncbi:MAG: hypothetical protein A2268_15345 [Candidatus Raymondbacteria bacterium RifOxyA12_full_50_37]|uniref:SxtJ n=1 Tax=Candidatus Raymondbacteria bacterium RIFOXYD12_FULL_49_13 TaxID=1817890 RepID=A0A1F7F725_UNCRA|nr:MAG: hypothetical protein A2268_15345 [Candidatus Raymondbacteria bacterium RifOxyA12_full_50_37]OGJ88472.1 MAG: hypothetical protein A2248_19920 [Candidatus Raymondbacteria bacterium RIFOXYA2_FULL_49_16]OGJ90645.1 MAG: hypothetical protein A2350_18595 [Candidatus Raymondbacteria bacterium RifOxyB12_full_50_8]OGJ98932.1 MAG: hypothetical protein A2453_10635 [Candidatus Raymondbacteria bacterium RIFOXYC2_FULL_50_21]OGK02368.1 MAG: hypothetical protein A2519_15980 [Candidatus Raymondbacteria b
MLPGKKTWYWISPMKEKTEIRKFGTAALLFFSVASLVCSHTGKIIASNVFLGLAALGLLLIVFPLQLRPLHCLWTRLGQTAGKVINVLVLGLFYYLFLTPFAVFRRLLFSTPLALNIEKDAKSYWVAREEFAQSKERFLKRY